LVTTKVGQFIGRLQPLRDAQEKLANKMNSKLELRKQGCGCFSFGYGIWVNALSLINVVPGLFLRPVLTALYIEALLLT